MNADSTQKILVFQQKGSGLSKIKGIKEHGAGRFELEIISIDDALPPILDDTTSFIPGHIQADLVLDFLKHPDLSQDLAAACRKRRIPLIASGKKLSESNALTPRIWCALSRQVSLGAYGERFGSPEFHVVVTAGLISRIEVLRGAPCGATWEAAARMIGLTPKKAAVRIGLDTQFFCTADPAGWDPMYGKSPVHFAGELHKAAMKRALNSA